VTARLSGRSRGILSRWADEARLSSARYSVSPDLAPFVAQYWTSRWDYRGVAPHVFESLAHPMVHLVLERGKSSIVGIVSGRFRRELAEQGEVLGIAFHPGGFAPFAGVPIARFTDRRPPMREVFAIDVHALEREVFAPATAEERIDIVEGFLRSRAPVRDARAELARRAVERCQSDRGIARVEQLAEAIGLRPRALQRLFHDYVGQPPKWVIQRARLHEATEQLAEGPTVDQAALAGELGYADQAHFIRDFRDRTGMTPARFRRRGR
jgi:AraC-like DNA-binding protein